MKNKYMNIKLFTLHLILIREGLKEVGFLVYSKGKPSKTSCRIFSAKGVPPPPTPLAENHFAKKTLLVMGGTLPPLNAKLFQKKCFPKGRKKMYLY